ncbi:MAG: hypothetical protein P8L37_02735, partial [Phycisphaerales bacterium]|nr:hypothetical protein [Phycisphaerales bacterium]
IPGIPILVDNGNIDNDGLPDLVTINEPESNGLRGLPGTLGFVQSIPTPQGACCTEDECSIKTEDYCVTVGGAWLGSDTACEPDMCTPGACCLDDRCIEYIETECLSLDGTWIAAGKPCDPTTCISSPCDGDLNDDSVINIDDLLIILGAWGSSDGDVNDDGLTNIDDILLVLSSWGDCP